MAFGIDREELNEWKREVSKGNIAFLTHYWLHPRFPEVKTVTKVGCADLERLKEWLVSYGLNPAYIHARDRYPHFDLIGPKQKQILMLEQQWDQINRFKL
ncbi:hypothetical protein [Paenibacillus alkalitolerans]|uniref:hypothetical protein n=1 Tax=Paenibacillus alkalitolerans TaxID=2799335 RepID=UPI0018F3B548|nr:hypothetical protein [Paenibacillus alkalitolerans]